MKFATYVYDGDVSCGVVDDGRVHPLDESMQSLLSGGLSRALDIGAEKGTNFL